MFDTQLNITIFCFHHAGGAASSLSLLKRDLSGMAKVILVQQPGRESRIQETAPTHIDIAAEKALKSIADGKLASDPYILFGHSMGGLIAHRVAELACEKSQPPLGLVVSAVRPPDDVYAKLLFDINFNDNASLLDFMNQFAPIPEGLIREKTLLDILLERFRSDIQVCQSAIRPILPLCLPIHAIAGLQDTHSPPAAMLGWTRATDVSFTLSKHPGDHFHVLREPSIITKAIKKWLISIGDQPINRQL